MKNTVNEYAKTADNLESKKCEFPQTTFIIVYGHSYVGLPEKSIFCVYVSFDKNHWITDNGLKEEIVKQNSWCAINDIWLGRHILKITLETVQHVQTYIDHGLLLDWLHVPSHNVNSDEVINVTICNNCLMFEDHVSSKCPQTANNHFFQRCSLCVANDHHYSNSNARPSPRRCLHCGGDHHAKVFKCSTWRRLKAQKRKLGSVIRSFAEGAQPINTQSTTAHPAVSTVDPRPISTHFNKAMNIRNCAQDWKKTGALTLLALLKDQRNPGCFRDELNGLFDQNDLPNWTLTGLYILKLTLMPFPVSITVMFSSLLSERILLLRKLAYRAL